MTETRKLPPMSVLEDAIRRVFANLFFAIRLLAAWALLLGPAAYGLLKLVGDPKSLDFRALPPALIAAGSGFVVLALLAFASITVNWYRRLLLGETPKGLAWWRLDGPVWRYLGNLFVVLVAVALLVAAAIAIATKLVPFLDEQLKPQAGFLGDLGFRILGYAGLASVVVGVSALTTWYRLAIKLPAASLGAKDFGFRTAWASTRWCTFRLLGLTFWYLFTLAIAGALGAGSWFGQAMLHRADATGAAFAFIALVGLIALLIWLTLSASLYSYYGMKRDFPKLR